MSATSRTCSTTSPPSKQMSTAGRVVQEASVHRTGIQLYTPPLLPRSASLLYLTAVGQGIASSYSPMFAPPRRYPGENDQCNAECGRVFEAFWDQCGAMLTGAAMGGMDTMGLFCTHLEPSLPARVHSPRPALRSRLRFCPRRYLPRDALSTGHLRHILFRAHVQLFCLGSTPSVLRRRRLELRP